MSAGRGTAGAVAGAEPATAATSPADVIAAATEIYLRGEPLDMSALASRLCIGRATLYRWVGNREELLGRILANMAERSWRAADLAVREDLARAGWPVRVPPLPPSEHGIVVGSREAHALGRSGDLPVLTRSLSSAEFVFEVLCRFMNNVITARPLRILSQREPIVFIRLVTMPGAVETRGVAFVTMTLSQQVEYARLELPLPAAVLAEAIVRICDSLLHAALLGRAERHMDATLGLVAMMLGLPRDYCAVPAAQRPA